MSRPEATLPPLAREVLDEILDELQSAESDALANAAEKDAGNSPFPYVAGYLAAIVDQQAKRLSRLLDTFPEPKDETAPSPKKGGS